MHTFSGTGSGHYHWTEGLVGFYEGSTAQTSCWDWGPGAICRVCLGWAFGSVHEESGTQTFFSLNTYSSQGLCV